MQEKKIRTREEYLDSMHRTGRIGVIAAITVMIGMPIIMSIAYSAFPSFGQIFTASIGLLAIFVPVTISEMISYTPVLGSSIYITLITGNITNLKLPVVTTALKQLELESGSEEADVISGISISISSIVTVLIIALGVLLMVPLKPFLTLPAVETATNYVLPALFGSMAIGIFSNDIGGGVKTKNRLLGAIPACIVVIIIFIISPTIVEVFKGILMVILLPVTYMFTKMLYNKGKIKVFLPGEEFK